MPPPRTAIIPPQLNPNVQQVIFGGQKGAAQAQQLPADAPQWLATMTGPPQYGPGMQMADAQRLENQGIDEASIFQQTGWYHAPDGQWKWVLPDKGASLNMDRFNPGKPDENGKPTVTLAYNSNQTLPEVLNHPSLYQVYPHLATAQVKKMPPEMDGGSVIASYDPDDNTVRLASNLNPQEATSTLLHELQHGVQSIEGFAEGGNKEQFYPSSYHDDAANAHKAWNALVPQLTAAGVQYPWILREEIGANLKGESTPAIDQDIRQQTAKFSPDLHNQMMDAVRQYQSVQQMQSDAYTKYRSLAGETEARQVQQEYELNNYGAPPTMLPGFVPANQQILSRPGDEAGYTNQPKGFQWGYQYDQPTPGTTVAPSDTTPPTAIQSIVTPPYDSDSWSAAEPGGSYAPQ